ncbi:MAG: diaminopimelate epimerase, partial [Planctomycetes bacterium]|nr:diaminopimelate epimerase [Planctomycetota bacterium]
VGMGNPHAVCFVDDADSHAVTCIGPQLEVHDLFPNRSNIEFVSVLPDENGKNVLRQRTWERGSGETEACGTGACATCVAAILESKISSREAIIRLNGGDLEIRWPQNDGPVYMSGPASFICDGEWPSST